MAEEEGDWGADLEGWGGGGAEGCLQGVTCVSVLGVDGYDGVLKGTSVSESVSSVDIRLELEINITGPTHTHAHHAHQHTLLLPGNKAYTVHQHLLTGAGRLTSVVASEVPFG